MEYPVEEILSYPLPALFVLAVFYGIYFAKMLAQKRRGIRTRQIGQRKEKSIHTVELLMSMATLGVVIAQLVTIAFGWSCLAANARFTGFVIGMLGDLIFLFAFSSGFACRGSTPRITWMQARRKTSSAATGITAVR